ncbi:hypothetical protein [Cupriavidus gilardii]|uniref:hypothetical protein n=1 Tax=Cupriavidus gilardii TaxID=82541 RepID=UPI000A6EDE35|nr:hypothetical protein [Cupriavidus gilardii]
MMQLAQSSPPAMRQRALLRSRKPLTKRELVLLFGRIKKRILRGGEPFGVFAIKSGRGRVFRLISVNHADYAAQLRVDKAQQHWIATYDGSADLGDVWDDLCSFDRE